MLHPNNNHNNHATMKPFDRTRNKGEIADAVEEAMRQINGAYIGYMTQRGTVRGYLK